MIKKTPFGIVIPADFGAKATDKQSDSLCDFAESNPDGGPTAFSRLAALIRGEEHTDISFMDMIVNAAATGNAAYCHVVAAHARDVLQEYEEQDTNYAEIILEVYRRTFFSEEHRDRFPVSFYIDTEERRAAFVAYIETSMHTQGSNVSMIKKPE